MATGKITNAAGPTTDFFHPTGPLREQWISETRLEFSARITSGPFTGERATITVLGEFDLAAGVGSVSEWRQSVDGRLHFSLRMDRLVPLDAFWQRRGLARIPGLTCRFSWQDLDEASASDKPMAYWIKTL